MSDVSAPAAGQNTLVLIIEDDAQIRRFLRTTLTSNGYRIEETATALDGINKAALRAPDVIILDLGLPDLDGLEVMRRLREWSSTPVIVVSAREQEHDKVEALDAGADDYLTKPFGTSELLARIRVALRHSARVQGSDDAVFEVGDLHVDLARRTVSVRGEDVHLTPLEYKLLTTLVRYAGRVVTHRQLLNEVWGPSYTNESHYLRVYMGQLRHKIEADPARPRYLLTEAGVGYRLWVD
ncbi:MAG TPA: response regulator [Aggregatilinea sp.]|jgi:two-component system KDP operon response regulator KdpE|uniref:response regulator n=1 Tax=Aggregatilinea sp. TaxID=2806333 RepID=UPI002CA4E23E|nr:response regulator [Aggregatilinea sp.]HML21221.1 response regulator [Aggregatilinea sp.]